MFLINLLFYQMDKPWPMGVCYFIFILISILIFISFYSMISNWKTLIGQNELTIYDLNR